MTPAAINEFFFSLAGIVVPAANRIIGEKVYEFEEDFRARKSELADVLRVYPKWQRVFTVAKGRTVAIQFLTDKADGYRTVNWRMKSVGLRLTPFMYLATNREGSSNFRQF